MRYLLIALGGSLGAILRVLISEALYKVTLYSLPLGIITVNIIGCFLVGLIFNSLDSKLEPLVVFGFLGAFTTFSAFSKETFLMIQDGQIFLAISYVCLSVILCLLATWLGMILGSKA
ncbi:MAG: fluoride efflux transporter CrcB [Gammaproteobacteria bacterium]